jgi:hypothetical protein
MVKVGEDFAANITLSTDSRLPGFNIDTNEDWEKLFDSISENVSKQNQTDFYRFLKKNEMFTEKKTTVGAAYGYIVYDRGVADTPKNREAISDYARRRYAEQTNTSRLHAAFNWASAKFSEWSSVNPEIAING